MKRTLLTTVLLVGALGSTTFITASQKKIQHGGYPIAPVPFTSVKVAPNSFWGSRLEASRKVTIPLAFSKCQSEGRYDNFVKAAHPSESYKVKGYSFDDTDVYKTIEGASYSLQTYPDKKMEAYIDSVITLMAAAQEPDGYLYTARTMNPKHPHEWAGPTRWMKEEDLSHEFYDLGHMIEGAIAYYQATGKRNFLDIAIKYADCVCKAIGPNKDQLQIVPGHQIAEMALAKLYLATGDKKYLDEAKFFLDYRGKTERKDEYSQAHKPVIEQDEAVGHAVRAGYMYSGMADVAALTGDSSYIKAIDRIWENIVNKKYYITGGVGATASGEAFGANYELPNMSAYNETCAAIGMVYMNYRLFLLHGQSKYYDVLERTLYNGVLSGVSIDGGTFFYPNPLKSMGQHQRQAWFGCACCPSNVCRFIPSVPGYAYAVKDQNLYINLFLSSNATIVVDGKKVGITQQTNYPWDGDIAVTVNPKGSQHFALKVRVPSWVTGAPVPTSSLYRYSDGKDLSFSITVNGEKVGALQQDGYFTIDRKWKKGDKVQIHFDMETRTVKANNLVEADRGSSSVERGPIVYCAEWGDNTADVLTLMMNRTPQFDAKFTANKLGGIEEVSFKGQSLSYDKDGFLQTPVVPVNLIPYYSWAHRGPGNMTVWVPQEVNATTPSAPATLASTAKVTSSLGGSRFAAITDGLVPKDGNDRSVPYIHWWPKKNSTEWMVYTFPTAVDVNSTTVYWFDDAPWGGCRVPKSWKIYYKDAEGQWTPVDTNSPYATQKGDANVVKFKSIKTTALKLEFVQPEDFSCGIFEWAVQ